MILVVLFAVIMLLWLLTLLPVQPLEPWARAQPFFAFIAVLLLGLTVFRAAL